MLSWDRHLETWIASHRVGFLDPVFRAITHSGNAGAVWLVLSALLALYVRRWEVFAWVAVTDGVAEGTNALLQRAVGRHRPRVHTLIPLPHSHSFPSGHTSSSFACAVVLSSFAPRLRVPLLVLAALVGFSRAYVGVHFPLDVLGGAAWGVLVGLALLDLKGAVGARALRGLPRRAADRRRSRRGRR